MRKLQSSKKFDKAYQKFVHHDIALQRQVDETIKRMEDDVFSPTLGAHKLTGNLWGLFACSCGYDCRIVFSIERDKNSGEEFILLDDVGTHDEVY